MQKQTKNKREIYIKRFFIAGIFLTSSLSNDSSTIGLSEIQLLTVFLTKYIEIFSLLSGGLGWYQQFKRTTPVPSWEEGTAP
jgi:hypothetical protein